MVLQGLKPHIFQRLEKFKARWVAELPSVLWSLRTTLTRGTGYTPFFMVHGLEAVLPTDIDNGSPRVRAYTHEGNQVSLEDAITNLTRHGTSHYYTLPDTNRRCDVIIASPFGKGCSKSEIWCFAGFRATRTDTSCHRHGKAPSSSTKSCVPTLTCSKMKKADPSPMLGTLSSYIASTLKKSSHIPKRKNSLVFLSS
jgi:hypothetical protein